MEGEPDDKPHRMSIDEYHIEYSSDDGSSACSPERGELPPKARRHTVAGSVLQEEVILLHLSPPERVCP